MCGFPPIPLDAVVSVVKKRVQSIDRVHDRHGLHSGIRLRRQTPLRRGEQLHCQSFQHNQSEFPPDAAPHPASERHVTETLVFALIPIRTEAIRVEQLRVLIGFGGLVRVADTVHDAPPLRDLITLQMGIKTISMALNFKYFRNNLIWA